MESLSKKLGNGQLGAVNGEEDKAFRTDSHHISCCLAVIIQDQQPTTNNQQPTTNNQQPKYEGYLLACLPVTTTTPTR
ncbi:MAG TPA: hypothetical protein DDZ80_18640 [Cyanobacteria bacterium UBA8803]|nr:hypothetical protein [Cyanobacteria bacterium UBA9273]HBL60396.1 hypothetical protein [Cyanobacteria bacterium UBA8803]